MKSGLFLALGLALLPTRPAMALSGWEVIGEVKRLDDSVRKWSDRSVRMRFEIARKGGVEQVKELKLYEKRYPNGRKKSLVHFLSPAEIRGTAFLQWTDPGKENRQWLYLPHLKRVRRISARAKSESFAGSDFSYRDLEIIDEIANWDEGRAKAKLSGDGEVEGVPCHVVTLIPKGDEGYRELVVWVSKKESEFHRIEFRDPRRKLEKILELTDFKVIDGVPTPLRSEMRDLGKQSQTTVLISDVEYNRNLKDEMFTERYLERGRR